MKQSFQLHFFYGENETAIRTPNGVYIDSSTVIDGVAKESRHKKGILHCGNISTDTFDQLVGCLCIDQGNKKTFEKNQSSTFHRSANSEICNFEERSLLKTRIKNPINRGCKYKYRLNENFVG